uniref:Uncharacterized protein n=1 Tax=Opuntia streptacantha TaxID=393608 RepID=A0A7C8YCJ1_OPUST
MYKGISFDLCGPTNKRKIGRVCKYWAKAGRKTKEWWMRQMTGGTVLEAYPASNFKLLVKDGEFIGVDAFPWVKNKSKRTTDIRNCHNFFFSYLLLNPKRKRKRKKRFDK